MNYTSSIIHKYGDTTNVKKDAETLHEILNRQGASLLIDVIAEQAGTAANSFEFSEVERTRTILSLSNELKMALQERL